MLMGNWAVALNLASITFLTSLTLVVLLSLAWGFSVKTIDTSSTQRRRTVLWLWVLAPWLLGLAAMLLLSPYSQQSAISSPINAVAHWHHFDVFHVGSWHGIALLMCLAFTGWLFCRTVRRLYLQQQKIRTLCSLSALHAHSFRSAPVISLASDVPTAFTAGFLRPTCYVSTGLAKRLTESELDIVVQHELAHRQRRDPLFALFFAALSGFYPRSVATQLTGRYSLVTEQLADQKASQRHAAIDIASTLIKVARLQKASPSVFAGAGACYFGADNISQRVQHLLAPCSSTPYPFLGLLVLMVVLLTVSTFMVDSLHHLIEFIFTH